MAVLWLSWDYAMTVLWLTGTSTDPRRLAVYRTLARARADCLAASGGGCGTATDPAIRNFTRFLAKIPEHTQGVQVLLGLGLGLA